MRSFISTSDSRDRRQVLLFVALVFAAYAATMWWNSANWGPWDQRRFARADLPGKLQMFFQNGNISPAVSRRFYAWGISTRPKYVVVGRDGWTYLGDNFEQAASKAAGNVPVDATAIQSVIRDLGARQDWLARRDIPFLFAIAPNKHSIYPEHSPRWLPFRRSAETDRFVQAARDARINIVDLREPLLQAKTRHDWLYTYTDTHWTALGAFIGYREMMLELARLAPGLRSLARADVLLRPDLVEVPSAMKQLGITSRRGSYREPGYALGFRRPATRLCSRRVERSLVEAGTCTPRADTGHLSDFLAGMRIENPDALNQQSLLLVEDSFGMGPSRYFHHSFRTTWQTHQGFIQSGERFRDFVAKYQPDLVILMVVERNLLQPHVSDW